MSAPADATTAPARGAVDKVATLGIGVQLLLALAVIHAYGIEGEPLRNVFAVVCGGWLVHLGLPVRWRLPAFLGVAVAALVAALGVADGLWVVLTGGVFTGLCLLPGSRWGRLAAVLAAAALLALLRDGVVDAPWSLSAWPILSSLFLFRAISFLYDRHHERERPPTGLAAAYFFLPPNACFPVFPVVDFKALRRGYDPASGSEVHQEGIERIVRGLIQLLFYRVVYHLAVVPIELVDDAASGVRYLVTNVLLIVRIMGIFHLSVGLLHLFGFRLPPTTHLPFLSPGFSEFWRRANIYWRDFVVKVFFYPAYFQLKGLGRLPAMVLATLATFAAAWFLHSYQWFWFQGEFPLRWQDGVYWSVFGVLVAANGLWSAIRGRTRRRSARPASVGEELARAARIAAAFATFTVLWSVWMTPSVEVWLALWRYMAADGLAALVPVGLVLGTVALLGVVWPDPSPVARGYLAGRSGWCERGRPWQSGPAVVGAMAALLLLVLVPGLAGRVAPTLERAVVAMAETGPNEHDADRRTEGYYQELAELPRFDTPEWQRDVARPDHWKSWRPAGLARKVDDPRMYAFKPSIRLPFKGTTLSTNAWALRDQEYTLEKPPGVVRIAVLGASTVAGSGVGDGETFEAVTEELFAERSRDGVLPPVEILNFGTPGYRIVRALAQLEQHAVRFEPDWVIMAAEKHAWRIGYKDLASAMRDGGKISPPALQQVIDDCWGRADVPEGTHRQKIKSSLSRCLEPQGPRIVEIVARRMAEVARERGFRLVWLELPTLGRSKADEEAPYRGLLDELGFVHLDASDVFEGYDRPVLEVAPWDNHPNALAHRLIGERLHAVLEPELVRWAASGGLEPDVAATR